MLVPFLDIANHQQTTTSHQAAVWAVNQQLEIELTAKEAYAPCDQVFISYGGVFTAVDPTPLSASISILFAESVSMQMLMIG